MTINFDFNSLKEKAKDLAQTGVAKAKELSDTAIGKGKSFKYDNSTDDGRYLNRRTEISFD